MNRLSFAILILVAGVGGAFVGHNVADSIRCRSAIGQLLARGALVVLVGETGIYEQDVQRREGEWRERATNGSERSALTSLIADASLRDEARREKITDAELEKEYAALTFQLPDVLAWAAALKANGLYPLLFRRDVAANLRATRWLDRQLANQSAIGEQEGRDYFEKHAQDWAQPARYRAAHLFLAAPPDTANEIVETKQRIIQELAARIGRGEKFSELVPLFSEDEATKKQGGDLGYFSEWRMPPDFMMSILRMGVGEIASIRTELGFHLVQLMEIKGVRQMKFEDALSDVKAELENDKRRIAVEKLVADSAKRAPQIPGK
ncbi:MAG: peptidylprolyl isomerase [Spartobacteria bacterium]